MRFMRGSGCTDKIFVVRQMCEKFLANWRDVYRSFMDLEMYMTVWMGIQYSKYCCCMEQIVDFGEFFIVL